MKTKQMQNKHLDHPEDEILTGNLSVLDWFVEVDSTVSVKIDGSPAIVFGTDPETDKFFVGTKSVFNKKKIKVNYSIEDILRNHGNTVRVAEILIACFDNLPRIDGIIQGDFIGYGGDDTYRPNTITYKFPNCVEEAIIFAPHTTYSGPNLRECVASFGADVPECENVKWVQPKASLSPYREDLEDVCKFAKQMSTLCEFVSDRKASQIKKEINSCIREQRVICEDEIAEKCDCDKNLIRLWKLVASIKADLFLFIHEDDEIECYLHDVQSFHEGFVITNKFGTYKVVDRETFSHANFTIEKNWVK
jgi:hypothetical protein